MNSMPRQTEIGVRLVETPGLHDPQNQALWEALPTAENQKTTDRQAGFLMPIAQNDVTPGTTTLRPILLPTLTGGQYGFCRANVRAFVFSYTLNLLISVLLLWSGHWAVEHCKVIRQNSNRAPGNSIAPAWPNG